MSKTRLVSPPFSPQRLAGLVLATGTLILGACGSDGSGGPCDEVGEMCACQSDLDCPGFLSSTEYCDLALNQCIEITGGPDVIDNDTSPDVADVGVADTTPDTNDGDTGQDTIEEVTPDAPDAEEEVTPDVPDVNVPDVPDMGEVGVDVDTSPTPPDPVNTPWLAYTAVEPRTLDTVYIVRADGTGKTAVNTTDLWQTQPTWSPDGRYLALVSVSGVSNIIRIMDMTTGQFRTLEPEMNYFAGLTWSPDGDRFVVEGRRLPEDREGGDYKSDLYTIDVDTGDVLQLTNTPDSETSPVWLNSDVIYYQSDVDSCFFDGPVEVCSPSVYRLNLDDLTSDQITFGFPIGGSFQVTWDETRLLLTRAIGDDDFELVRYNIDSETFEKIGPDRATGAALSPDSNWVVLVEEVVPDQRDIRMYDMNTLEQITTARPITDDALTERRIAIGPVEAAEIVIPFAED